MTPEEFIEKLKEFRTVRDNSLFHYTSRDRFLVHQEMNYLYWIGQEELSMEIIKQDISIDKYIHSSNDLQNNAHELILENYYNTLFIHPNYIMATTETSLSSNFLINSMSYLSGIYASLRQYTSSLFSNRNAVVPVDEIINIFYENVLLSIQRSGLSHHYDQAIENLLKHWNSRIKKMESNNSIIDYPEEIESLYNEIRLSLISLKQNDKSIQNKVQNIITKSAKNAVEYHKHITKIIKQNCLLSKESSKYSAILEQEIIEFQQTIQYRIDDYYQKLISLFVQKHENSISTTRIGTSLLRELNLLKHGKLLHIEHETIKEEKDYSQSSTPTCSSLHKQAPTIPLSHLIEEEDSSTTSTYSEITDEEPIEYLSIQEQLIIFNNRIFHSHGMHAVNFTPDNNSFFHAIINQLNRLGYYTYTPESLRDLVINYLNNHPEETEEFTAESVNDYILHILTSGTWADSPLLQSLSQLFGVSITIVTDNNQNPTQIVGDQLQQEIIYLGYINAFNYVSLEVQTSSSSSVISTDLETNSENWSSNYEGIILTGIPSFEGITSNQTYPFKDLYDDHSS